MYTSVTERRIRRASKTALIYLAAALMTALFGAIYELFSHGVYSYWMLYAFLFPLAGGSLPFLVLALRGTPMSAASPRFAWHAGIAVLTIGSVVEGMLEIYGTTNRLTMVYWTAGPALLLYGMIGWLLTRRK